MNKVFLFSACLLGLKCRYDGGDCLDRRVRSLFRERGGLVLCPEQLGGLPTPRDEARLISTGEDVRVVTVLGRDVTASFRQGRDLTVAAAKALGVTHAVLKDKSPSCGVRTIVTDDGWREGSGLTTSGLRSAGIQVIASEDLEETER